MQPGAGRVRSQLPIRVDLLSGRHVKNELTGGSDVSTELPKVVAPPHLLCGCIPRIPAATCVPFSLEDAELA